MRYARSWLVSRLTCGCSSSTCLLLCICRHLLRQHLEAAAAACTTHAATVPLADAVQLHVYCSPFSRTIETATLAAAQAGLSSNSSERLQVGACVADAVPKRATPRRFLRLACCSACADSGCADGAQLWDRAGGQIIPRWGALAVTLACSIQEVTVR